jgi:hypothetical protein
MRYSCDCGLEYVVIPKEIPLVVAKKIVCSRCGGDVRGLWSPQFFDYEPIETVSMGLNQ